MYFRLEYCKHTFYNDSNVGIIFEKGCNMNKGLPDYYDVCTNEEYRNAISTLLSDVDDNSQLKYLYVLISELLKKEQ